MIVHAISGTFEKLSYIPTSLSMNTKSFESLKSFKIFLKSFKIKIHKISTNFIFLSSLGKKTFIKLEKPLLRNESEIHMKTKFIYQNKTKIT